MRPVEQPQREGQQEQKGEIEGQRNNNSREPIWKYPPDIMMMRVTQANTGEGAENDERARRTIEAG